MEMEIAEFIKEAVEQVCEGIISSAKVMADKTGNFPIAPGRINGRENPNLMGNIDFEVSTVVKKEYSVEGGIKCKIVVASVDGMIDASYEKEVVTKIKFSIPVMFSALHTKPGK